MALTPPPRALFFDVFGTCVDWRKAIVDALHAQAHASLNSATASMASTIRVRASDMTVEHWALFAQQWRDSYKKFTRRLADNPSLPWVSVDEHHLTSLKELLVEWNIDGLWDSEELRALSLVWHHLGPWDDSVMGVALLNRLYETCTLSNGNLGLLSDLRAFSGIAFTHVLSAEMFGTYKPASRVYLGAAQRLQLQPKQCAMVAAHLNDLKAAKQNGFLTIYVERPGEEDWSEDKVVAAKQEGWVDLWIGLSEGTKGFITVAEILGVDMNTSDQADRLSSSAPVGTT